MNRDSACFMGSSKHPAYTTPAKVPHNLALMKPKSASNIDGDGSIAFNCYCMSPMILTAPENEHPLQGWALDPGNP